LLHGVALLDAVRRFYDAVWVGAAAAAAAGWLVGIVVIAGE